jgi:hypothetical protein
MILFHYKIRIGFQLIKPRWKSFKIKSKKLVIYPYSISSNLLKEVF